MVICLKQGADLHVAQLMPLLLTVCCSSKSRLVLPFWYQLTWVVHYFTVIVCCVNYRHPPTVTRPRADADGEASSGPDHSVTLADRDVPSVMPNPNTLSAPQTKGTDRPVTEGADTLPAVSEHNVKYKPSTFRPNGVVTLSSFQPRDNIIMSTSECNGDNTVTSSQPVTLSTSQSKAGGTHTASQANGTVTTTKSRAAPSSRQVFLHNSKAYHKCI